MSQSTDALKQRACARIDDDEAALVDISKKIHDNPELNFQEYKAAGWLADYLEQRGFAVERGAYGMETAFRAVRGSGEPRVAILCEYDALPGVGHACGHNVIATAGAGAGVGAAEVLDKIGGTVIVLGTPAEEGGGGKIIMGERGAFDGIDAAMMVHPAGVDLPAMHVLAVSQVAVEYRGRAAHASASPHRGINALDAMVTAYQSIAQLRQHIRSTERIHGIITDGGQVANIVPERAAGMFMVRAATSPRLEQLKKRVNACLRGAAEASGAEVSIQELGVTYSDMWTNTALVDCYADNAKRVGRNLLPMSSVPGAVAGSTDMGNVSKWLPSIHPMIAVAPAHVPLHSAEFARWTDSPQAARAVVDGAKIMAMTAIEVLADPTLRQAMRAEFERERSGADAPDAG